MKIGDRIRWNGATCHVVTIFQDKNDGHVVLREWWPRRQRWHYFVESIWLIDEVLSRPSKSVDT